MSLPPGWYEDPWNRSSLRWWDGTGWTDRHAARPAVRPTFSSDAFWPALAGVVITVLVARIVGLVLLDGLDAPSELYIVTFYAAVFGGLWFTCLTVSRRFGTGRPSADFGLAWKPSDIWAGLGLFFLSRVAQVIAFLPWADEVSRVRRLTEGLEHVSTLSFLLFAATAMIAAPVFEELVFRGMLQRSLTARTGSGSAVVIQGALFGLYHLTPGLGGTNVPYVVALAAVGMVFGWGAARWGRLGPSSTAHFLVNALSVALLYGNR